MSNARVQAGESLERFIVVGVDGSKPAAQALEWALKEARMREVGLKVVHAWHVPALAYGAYIPAPSTSDFQQAAAKLLDDQLKSVIGDDPGVPVARVVVEGPAAGAIVDASEGAELVVVGSRGLGGFTGLVLGSVSAQVAHHAHCPVTLWRESK